jgi:hypothetical protein
MTMSNLCIFDDNQSCPVCRRRTKFPHSKRVCCGHPGCKPEPPGEPNQATETVSRKNGLGDIVAGGLSAVGITKERVSRAIGRPCGCAKRQEKLNELGRKFGIG